MILSIELTDTEYVAIQNALKYAAVSYPRPAFALERDKLELLHLRTLLAEASVKDNQ